MRAGSKRALTARAVILALVAGVLLAVALAAATGLSWLLAYVLAIGLVTFAFYGYDKQQAVRGRRRLTNQALILLSLLGGALGGWAGMFVWRHKLSYTSFWVAHVVGTVEIVAALVLS